ncbi:DUF1396 domain-containing protein [Streptomyces sp. NBC_01429]|uniref:DUF1396 domain-containing protein n=1 Tax=Streptomyces sp. NBC_01429 TaxID=2903862 RepID=UPI002E2D36B9|nr:DUF1396 domain-containing protein [Streptomyces sp. NBC_01429]
MNSMYRTAAVTALGGLLLCSTVACSSSDSADSASSSPSVSSSSVEMTPAAAIKRAAGKNEKITSLSYTMEGKVPGEGTVSGDVAMSVKPPAMRMKMAGESEGEKEEIEILLTSDGMYMGGDSAAADPEMDGKRWIKFPMGSLDDMSAAGGENPLGGLSSQVDRNPAAESASLALAKDLKRVGEETVDGVKTTHYQGSLPLSAMKAELKGLDAETKKKREKSLKAYEDMGIEKLTMDMWIDGDDLTKQFRTRATTESGPLDMTVKFGEYNKPVEIKAPPASEVADLGEMMSGAEGS